MAVLKPLPRPPFKYIFTDEQQDGLPTQQFLEFLDSLRAVLNLFNGTSGGIVAPLGETYAVRGLRAFNNAGAPTTRMDITYSEVMLRDANGLTALQFSSAFTVDTGVAGPVLNGRDQAGAFA